MAENNTNPPVDTAVPVERRAQAPDRRLTARHNIEVDQLFQAIILENVKDCVIATDMDGKITYWNKGACEIFGFTYGETLGEPITRISRPGEVAVDEANQLSFMKLESPVTAEWEGVKKGGNSVSLLLTYLPMRNKEGKILGLIRIGKDITEHKIAEKALHDSEIRYRRLFEAAKDGVLLLDAATGQITDVNPFLIDKLGYSKKEFISKKIWEIGAFKDTELSKAVFNELQEKGFINYENMPLMTKDGRLLEVEFVSNVYLVEGAKVIQCNIRDITERKKAENALRESELKLKEQNALLEQKNIALREIMNQNRDEKERIEKQVQANVDHLLKPLVENLKGKGSLIAERHISLLEANLKEITSSFGSDISSRMFRLTQKEIDVCNMIKNGFSSKAMAESMHVSIRTVETHRNSIRKKLDVSRKKVNLATYLKFLR